MIESNIAQRQESIEMKKKNKKIRNCKKMISLRWVIGIDKKDEAIEETKE